MNNTFNLQRFLLLFKKHTVEHARPYLLTIVVMFGVSLLLLEFIAFSQSGNLKNTYQAAMFTTILLACGSIYTSLSFSTLGNKRQAIGTLTLPASNFEKYLLQWVYSFVIFQLVCMGVFYVADIIVVGLNPSVVIYKHLVKNTVFSIFDTRNDAYAAFVFYALFHGLAFWGAIFFEKLHFIKTAFVFFISLILLSILGQTFLNSLINREISHNSLPWGGLSFTDEHRVVTNLHAPASIVAVSAVILVIVVVLLWVSAFFRLKEKQV